MQIIIKIFLFSFLIISSAKLIKAVEDAYYDFDEDYGDFCIKARFDIKFTYIENGSIWTVEIPPSSKNVVDSICDDYLYISWNNAPVDEQMQNNTVSIKVLEHDENFYMIYMIEYFFDRNKYNFPSINTSILELIEGNFIVNSSFIGKYQSYKCASSTNYTDNLSQGEIHMEMKNFQFETFTRTEDFKFNSSSKVCRADQSKSTTPTTTTETTTTTIAPSINSTTEQTDTTTNSAVVDEYGVRDSGNGLYCIKARFDVKFTYTENGSTWTAEISTIKNDLSDSVCDDNLFIRWNPENGIDTTPNNTMSITVAEDRPNDYYIIHTIDYFFDRNEYNFPGINTSISDLITGSFTINSTEIYKTESFQCISTSNYTSDVTVNATMHMEMKSFQFETFTRTSSFEFSTDVSTCFADPTSTTEETSSTIPPTTPPPEVQFYGLPASGYAGNTNSSGEEEEPKFCITAEFGAKIEVTYKTKLNKFKNVTIFVPINGEVGGKCGENIQIIWPYNISDIVNNSSKIEDEHTENSNITIKFIKPTAQKLSWTIENIIVNLTTEYFPGIKGHLTHEIWEIDKAGLNTAQIPINHKFMCNETEFTNGDNITLTLNSFSIAAFTKDAKNIYITISCSNETDSEGDDFKNEYWVIASVLTSMLSSTIIAIVVVLYTKIYHKYKNKQKYNVHRGIFQYAYRKRRKRYNLNFLNIPIPNNKSDSDENDSDNDNNQPVASTSNTGHGQRTVENNNANDSDNDKNQPVASTSNTGPGQRTVENNNANDSDNDKNQPVVSTSNTESGQRTVENNNENDSDSDNNQPVVSTSNTESGQRTVENSNNETESDDDNNQSVASTSNTSGPRGITVENSNNENDANDSDNENNQPVASNSNTEPDGQRTVENNNENDSDSDNNTPATSLPVTSMVGYAATRFELMVAHHKTDDSDIEFDDILETENQQEERTSDIFDDISETNIDEKQTTSSIDQPMDNNANIKNNLNVTLSVVNTVVKAERSIKKEQKMRKRYAGGYSKEK